MRNKNAIKIVSVVVLLVFSNYLSWNIGKSGDISRLGENDSVSLPTPENIPGGMRVIGGTIESISDSGFSMKTFAYDPFASQGPSVRNVTVSNDTVIES